MKELALFAEVEYSKEITNFTILEAGIWQVILCAIGDVLPFMEDGFNRIPIKISNVIINNEEYTRLDSLNELRVFNSTKGAWVNMGNFIYIRFPNFEPPYVYFSRVHGTLMGFTDGNPVLKDGILYKSGLLNTPIVAHSVDALTYDRMKFNSANISIDNSDGQFDNAGNFFGNDFNLKVGVVDTDEGHEQHLIRHEAEDEKIVSVKNTDEHIVLCDDKEKKDEPLKMLAQYYIENISVSLNKADFKLNDKRERLSAKIPNKQFTKEEFPYIDDNLLDRDMQEAYGRCLGVPGTSLENKRILDQYRFRFSSKISRIDRIIVKMTTGKIGEREVDGWTVVYENGLWKEGVLPGSFAEMASGIISLSYAVAKAGGQKDGQINEVCVDGVFNDPEGSFARGGYVTPKDIIKHILLNYSNVEYRDDRYNLEEFERELSQLDSYEIGILFDKSISVYEAIEKLQGGSVLGFQFCVYNNLFTARLDNPNREELPAVSHLEIMNLSEIEVDWNATLYGSNTNIEYAHNYGGNEKEECRKLIDNSRRKEILAVHRVEKEWAASTLLLKERDAQLKSSILLEDFSKLRPIIKNIKLFGEKWFNLRVYDIMYIDFSIPGDEIEKYPQYLIRLIKEVGEEKVISKDAETDEYAALCSDEKTAIGKRDFIKSVRCQLLKINKDTRAGVTTIDARIIEQNTVWEKR
jgi:hypothetical protein